MSHAARRIFAVWTVLGCLLAPSLSPAGVVIQNESDLRASLNRSRLTHLVAVQQVGAPSDADLLALLGGATNTPLLAVLRQIVPAGWTVYAVGNKLNKTAPVSWKAAGRSWPVVLDEILSQRKLVARIDWERKELTITKGALK